MTNQKTIVPGGRANGEISVPGDKSISIRAVLFSSISEGINRIENIGLGADIKSAIACMKQLGVEIDFCDDNTLTVKGRGLRGLRPCEDIIDCSNSGTTMRLISGILAGQKYEYTLSGDSSLNCRPMERIFKPLRMMNKEIECLEKSGYAPFKIKPGRVTPVTYEMPVASAQVKSAVILAGLYADGITNIIEKTPTRDHTELMLKSRGVKIENNSGQISVTPPEKILPVDMKVPGDISGAAFFIVLASILPDSFILIKDVGINPTRSGIVDVLKDMGANIKALNIRNIGGELTADIEVKSAKLKGITISGDTIPGIIDEIPVLSIAAAAAEGTTTIKNAEELRVKETDRIRAVCLNLKKMGAEVEELHDGMTISGGKELTGASVESYDDHRIAMAFSVAGTISRGETIINNSKWADISFPGFYELLNGIRGIN